MEHIVIIGNGIAGVTAARHIRKKSDKKVTIISKESPYFFSRPSLMYVYMGHMRWKDTKPYEDFFWKKNKIDLIEAEVKEVNPLENQLVLSNGRVIVFDKLIIATGSKSNKFGWKGQDLKKVQGLYSKQDLETLEKNAPNNKACKRAVIVGGGLIGIEFAEMLLSRDIPVTFLVREESFWDNVLPKQESNIINKHIREHHIDLRLGVNLKEIISNAEGEVKSVIIQETGEEIVCDVVGLTAGVSPNIQFLENSKIELNRGVKVNRFLQTNFDTIYAIGDCAEQTEPSEGRRSIEAVWYTGRMMGETVAQTICGNKTAYKPGYWFNSAKFLDIEYQTYGMITAQVQKNESRFYWEHEGGKKCIHINYDTASRKLIGINTLGIRLRHSLFDQWLNENQTIEYVLEHLKDANFDPEFYKTYENEIVGKFNLENNASLKSKNKNWKNIFKIINT